MTDPGSTRQKSSWDPVGFLLLIFLLIAFGGAILFLIGWIKTLIETAS